ncbi:MAG: hypothetical protein F6J97_00875 [Leptolyngbya sp. SIO4C1]|nr:hypothetical protein [Leptolyngbya sp. SIO4C1]
MKQLELNPKPDILNACAWARLPHRGAGIVLAVPKPLPLGLAPWLRSQGWQLAGYAEDRGQAAVWLIGGVEADLLGWLPRPRSEGSRTAGNLLPW